MSVNRKMKSKSNNNQSDLPWLVELLFVQIGLPDSWLSNFLKTKKETNIFIKENKKNILLIFLLFAGVLYFYPIVKYTSSSSSCITKTIKYLKTTNSNNLNQMDLNSLAVGYCHGGTLPR